MSKVSSDYVVFVAVSLNITLRLYKCNNNTHLFKISGKKKA